MAINLERAKSITRGACNIPKPAFEVFQVCLLYEETEEGPSPPFRVQIVGLEFNPGYARVEGWWYAVSAVGGWLEPHLGKDYHEWVHESNLMLV